MRNHNVQHLLPATFIIMALMGGAADAQAQTWVQAGMLRCRLNPSIASSSSAISLWNAASNQSRVQSRRMRVRSTQLA